MNNSDRNLEALSAYLDGELTGNDRERIEKLLQEDENLQNWHEELNRTRTILRSTPALRAPRNYMLTPEMVGQKEKVSRAFPILRFASAFAALLLVLLFLGDLFVIPRPMLAPARSIQIAESIQLDEEAAVAEAETFTGQPPDVPAEPLMEAAPMEGEPAAEAEFDENISSSMDSAPAMEKSLPTPSPPIVEEAEDMLAGTAGTLVVGESEIEPESPSLLPEDDSRSTLDLRSYVRFAEFVLLIVALSSGIAAYYFFRRKSTP